MQSSVEARQISRPGIPRPTDITSFVAPDRSSPPWREDDKVGVPEKVACLGFGGLAAHRQACVCRTGTMSLSWETTSRPDVRPCPSCRAVHEPSCTPLTCSVACRQDPQQDGRRCEPLQAAVAAHARSTCGACLTSCPPPGTFGRVLECWDRKHKSYVAIKIVRNVQKYRDAAMIEVGAVHASSQAVPSWAARARAQGQKQPGAQGRLQKATQHRPAEAGRAGRCRADDSRGCQGGMSSTEYSGRADRNSQQQKQAWQPRQLDRCSVSVSRTRQSAKAPTGQSADAQAQQQGRCSLAGRQATAQQQQSGAEQKLQQVQAVAGHGHPSASGRAASF